MMRSLFAGVSGLKNHQTRMDVIGNNMANVNTVGFKSGRVNFQDVMSQTLQNATAAQGTRGGTNPMQVGLGMGIATIDSNWNDGSFQSTGKNTDLALEGNGFYVVTDGINEYYTRAGNFDFDTAGNLITSTGNKVMGYMADAAGNIQTAVTPIVIPKDATMTGEQTTTVTFGKNLASNAAIGTSVQTTSPVYDSQGNAHQADITFTKVDTDTWVYRFSAADGSVPRETQMGRIIFDSNGAVSSIKTLRPTTIAAGTTVNLTTFQMDKTVGSVKNATFAVYDGTGEPRILDMSFTANAGGSWDYVITEPAVSATAIESGNITFAAGAYTFPATLTGGFVLPRPGGGSDTVTIPLPTVNVPPDFNAFNCVATPKFGATTNIAISNIKLDSQANASHTKAYTVIDNNGAPHVLNMKVDTTGGTNWNYTITDTSANNATVSQGTISYAALTGYTFAPVSFAYTPVGGTSQTVTFGMPALGSQLAPQDTAFAVTSSTYDVTSSQKAVSYVPTNGRTAFPVSLSLNSLTQTSGTIGSGGNAESTATVSGRDGYAQGTITGVYADNSGTFIGKFSNGRTRNMAQVVLSIFNNPGGLNKNGDTLFTESTNSGLPQYGKAGSAGYGDIQAGTLEMSNVDLAQEFSNMIVTQRGYQTNSKIITVSDEMLQELVNLKR